MSTQNARRLVALAIGISTIFAGVLTWRASQINSTASFDDRSSIGQTLAQGQIDIGATAHADNLAAAYGNYLDSLVLAEQLSEAQASDLRDQAAARAVAIGLFDPIDVGLGPPPPFSLDDARADARIEPRPVLSIGGALDPDTFADDADSIRARVRALQTTVLVIMVAVAILTIAEVTRRPTRRAVLGAAGAAIAGTAFAVALLGWFT